MDWIRYILAGLLGCAMLHAQTQMTCHRVEQAPATIRAEGTSELLADVLISCTGGTPAAKGAALPQFQILAISNTPLNPRIVPPPKPTVVSPLDTQLPSTTQLTEALAIVDEARDTDQVVCVPAASSDFCAAAAGSFPSPNVFQAVLVQENVVLFSKVPIDPPGAGKNRIIRITNLRASAAKIPKLPNPDQITLTLQIFDRAGQQIPLESSAQVTAVAKPGVRASVRTVDDREVNVTPALTVTPAMLPQNNPGHAHAFLVRFTEGFPSAFKRRNLGTTAADPNFLVSQADPGGQPNTETGFFNNRFPSINNLNSAGLADSGTRLKLVLTDIPLNVSVWASARDVDAGTTGYSESSPRAMLTYANDNGAGFFNRNFPAMNPFAVFYVDKNTLTLVWEVVAANADVLESITFEIRLFAPNGPPRTGTALMKAGLAPVEVLPSAVDDTALPSLPSFSETKDDPIPVFQVVSSLNQATLTSTSAASFSGTSVAPSSLVAGFGSGLSAATETSGAGPVDSIAGVRIEIIDNSGVKRTAPLLLVSPGQINFMLSPATALGQAAVSVFSGSQIVASGTLRVSTVSPALFSAEGTGRGRALGQAVTVFESGARSMDLAHFDSVQNTWQSNPVDLSGGGATFLTLFGTGFRNRSNLDAVTLKIGDLAIPVTFAGPQGSAGMDQLDAGPLPASLAGRGDVVLTLTVDGKTANPLTITVK